MQRLNNVEFDHKPQDVEVYKSGVDVVVRCEEKQKTDTDTGEVRTVWECDLERYDSDEYIKLQMATNAVLQKQVTDTQLALCDVYELILNGGM